MFCFFFLKESEGNIINVIYVGAYFIFIYFYQLFNSIKSYRMLKEQLQVSMKIK